MRRLGPAEKLLMATVPQTQLKLPTVLLAVAMVVATAAGVHAATASWDANTEPDLAGYKLSYGTQSGVHTVVIDVGKVTTYQFNPPGGRRYYVVVQAYNTAGELSAKSSEVVVDIPGSSQPGIPAPGQPPAPPPTQPPGGGGGGLPAPPGGGSPPPAPQQRLTLVQPPNQTTRINTSVVLTVSATHLDGQALTFSAAGLPPGLSISRSGVISGIPHTLGHYLVTVTAAAAGVSASGNFSWSIVSAL